MCLRNLFIPTISPAEGELGSVTVNAADVVLQKYPLPLTAVNPEVLTVVSQVTAPIFQKLLGPTLLFRTILLPL